MFLHIFYYNDVHKEIFCSEIYKDTTSIWFQISNGACLSYMQLHPSANLKFEFYRFSLNFPELQALIGPLEPQASIYSIISFYLIWIWSLVQTNKPMPHLFAFITSWSTVCRESVFLEFFKQNPMKQEPIIYPNVLNSFNMTLVHGESQKTFTSYYLKRYFPTFHCRTSSFCCLPICSALELFIRHSSFEDYPNFFSQLNSSQRYMQSQ